MMMKKVSCWLFAVALAVLPGCSRQKSPSGAVKAEPEQAITGSSSDPAVEFKTLWKPDLQYRFYFRQIQDIGGAKADPSIKHKRKGGLQDQERIFAEDYSLQVTNTPTDRKVELAYQIQSLEVDIAYGEQYDFVFDSENKAVPVGTDPMSTALQRLIGGNLTVDLKDNKVRRVAGAKELAHQALDGLDAGRAGGLDRILSDEAIRHLIEFDYLPTNAVAIGNSWQVKTHLTTGYLKTEADVTCTFTGWQVHDKRKCALFTLNGTLTSDTPNDKSGVEDGHLTGRVWFDPELGMTADEEIEQTSVTSFKRNKTGETTSMPVTQSASLMLADVLLVDKKPGAAN